MGISLKTHGGLGGGAPENINLSLHRRLLKRAEKCGAGPAYACKKFLPAPDTAIQFLLPSPRLGRSIPR